MISTIIYIYIDICRSIPLPIRHSKTNQCALLIIYTINTEQTRIRTLLHFFSIYTLNKLVSVTNYRFERSDSNAKWSSGAFREEWKKYVVVELGTESPLNCSWRLYYAPRNCLQTGLSCDLPIHLIVAHTKGGGRGPEVQNPLDQCVSF